MDNLQLSINLHAALSEYCLEAVNPSWKTPGPSRLGFECPDKISKSLAELKFIWFGDYNAGLVLSIANSQDVWFRNENAYFEQIRNDKTCSIRLNTGSFSMSAGEKISLKFVLYVTPFKPLSKEHWNWRYYHKGYGNDLDIDQGINANAKVFVQHHASPNCPYISYLFPVADRLKKMADRIHANGGLFKVYNTIRELSTRANELWALRSLGHEILLPTEGNLGYESLAQLPLEYQLRDQVNEPFTGQTWMCEHLVDDYHARWHSSVKDKNRNLITEDSSLQISGASRWSNFYIESQRWLMEHVGLDGLYLDGVTFDRASFIRVRKTLVRTKPEALIDWHGSPAEIIDFLSMVDSIWFGEAANYSREPAYWLTAVSGIPFGTPGELLMSNASVQRGMVFGVSQRYAWMSLSSVDPSALWKWWDSFDIMNAEMIGYWQDNCPVSTDNPDTKATVYLHKGNKLAIAIASWAEENVKVKLTIDWKSVGLSPEHCSVTVPEIRMFQRELNGVDLDAIEVEPEKGWLIVVEGVSAKR
ncbi:MAG: hypothetical protein GX811_08085 [Lentisphaerae bacterium]|nr:hypothetical protein [Lentisphaerota bacterium]